MKPSTKVILLIPPLLLFLNACTSTRQWSANGGDREAGRVRLSYQYPEFHQPDVSDAQALALAASRCEAWGYQRAEPIAGQVRECSEREGGSCDLWKVTREYQCEGRNA